MKRLKWLALITVLVLALPLMPAGAQVAGNAAASSKGGNWYIVQFEDPPLAAYATATVSRRSVMTVGGKLNVSAPASQAYVGQLKKQQAAFTKSLAAAIPGARVERGYQIVLNAVAVELPSGDLAALKTLWSMPGVTQVSPQQIYTVEMDYSLPAINAPALWSQLGGREAAGEGIKIAVIDSGIDPDHALFDGTGWSYPSTDGPWPKGYCADHAGFCNGKIISARYYRPTFEVNVSEVLSPQDIDGHGSHVGGIAVGNIVTATYGTDVTLISGVAPGAWIMAYKGLYLNATGTTGSGSSIMLAGAIEDAIADGADVVNNSWGSSPLTPPADDPLTQAYEAAADAGVVVVFAIGNAGPGYNTAGRPSSPKFISVGGTTTQRAYYNALQVTAPTPVTDTLQNFPATEMHDVAPSAIPTTTIGPLPYLPTGLTGELLTGVTETVGSLVVPTVTMGITMTAPYSDGWIAVIPRGAYNFSDKVAAARAQGAVAAVIYLPPGSGYSDDDWKGGFTVQNEALYTVITGKMWGGGLVEWWKTSGDQARLQIGYPVSPYTTETADVIYDSSSRGPQVNLAIEPDVMAPAVNILSADPTGAYAAYNGTSMASPHVAGTAALLLQQHPTWTWAQVKSALMSTASQTVLNLDKMTTANVMAQGSGRIDLSKVGDPGLTFDKPSHSFGMVPQGSTDSVIVTATDVSGMAETYALSIQETVTDTGNVTVTVSPATLDVAADGTASFTLSVEVGAGATAQDLEGNVVVSGTTHMAHIPYWLRVYQDTGAEVLLVDFDESEATGYGYTTIYGLPFGDYTYYYTSTLEALGVSYDYWNVWNLLSPPRAVLDQYDKVIIYSGDYGGLLIAGGSPYLGDTLNANDFRNYLAAGGKMVVTGQEALGDYYHRFFGLGDIDPLAPYMRGAADVPLLDGVRAPVVVGVGSANPFLKGMLFDLTPLGDGAGNQMLVDELDYRNYTDMDTAPLFKAIDTVTDTVEAGYVATRSSYEPTIERVQDPIGTSNTPVLWRVAFLGFGLEGVNDDTGFNTRADLLGALFCWLDDTVMVTFGSDSYAVAEPFGSATFTATMTSSLMADDVLYQWDFGDGSDIAVTTDPTVSHQYLDIGTYWARVEVMDEFGHKAVSGPVEVKVGHQVFLPLTLR